MGRIEAIAPELVWACLFGLVEAFAIVNLAGKPKPDVIDALEASLTANVVSTLLLVFLGAFLAENWIAALPGVNAPPIIGKILGWICAFILANAAELTILTRIWKVSMSTSLAVFISMANLGSAYLDLHQILQGK